MKYLFTMHERKGIEKIKVTIKEDGKDMNEKDLLGKNDRKSKDFSIDGQEFKVTIDNQGSHISLSSEPDNLLEQPWK